MKYYLKKLGFQELGYRAGKPGGGGRYVYVSKECLNFFPPLSDTELNDFVLLQIVPPFSGEKVYTKFVYHNDKLVIGGTRDEYRLYLNKNIDPNGDFYKKDDILIFERHDIVTEGELVPLYFLSKFQPGENRYDEFDKIILESPIKGGHALWEGDFKLEYKVGENATKVVIPEEIKEEVALKFSEGEMQMGAKLFNSVSFRDFVLNSYENKCAITKKSISWENLTNLEAAHIKPKAHEGTFLPCNGIALSRDMHWAFDKGFISIDDNYKVIVHGEVKSELLKEIDGTEIILPLVEFFKPNKEYLKYHRENIFGLFKRSASIRTNNNI